MNTTYPIIEDEDEALELQREKLCDLSVDYEKMKNICLTDDNEWEGEFYD